MKTRFNLLAVATPGLEGVVKRELVAHGIEVTKIVPGGVEFKGNLQDIIHANLTLHTPSRILLRLGQFEAKGLGDLVGRVSRYPWEIYITRDVPLKIRVTARRSKLWHSGAVKERLLQGIERRLGHAPSSVGQGTMPRRDAPYQLIVCRIVRDRCTIQVDTSGDFLFMRGYKDYKGLAPLRENLAASLCIASGWDMSSPLMDPFCGTGTIVIEAALMATGTPPGKDRRFPFMRWRIFDMDLYQAVLDATSSKAGLAMDAPPIYASDRDGAMVHAARENAKRAGVAHYIAFGQAPFKALRPPGGRPGWIVTNLPFGRRLKEGGGRAFLNGVLEHLRDHFSQWEVHLLMPCSMAKGLGHRLEKRIGFQHGGIRVGLFRHICPPSRR